MPDSDDEPEGRLARRLLEETHEGVPRGAFGRLRRTAMAALRTGRMLRRSAAGDDGAIDADRLEEIIASMGQLKGIAMKAGQIMSYIDVAIPDELRQSLAVLQTHSQAMPFERVEQVLVAELGEGAAELLHTMERAPIAAASIGQVHRARLADGAPVAVKVQYPDIDRAIAADFGPAAVGTRMASLFYPGARVDTMVREARERFLQECDYRHEADRQADFARLFAGHPVVSVPAVHARLSTQRVLTTAWIDGARFDDYLADNPPQEARDRLGKTLFEFYIGTLFRHGLYNCDPHPGNYLVLPEHRIAILDYGCTRRFEPAFVAQLARLTEAVHADERDQLHRAFCDLGMVKDGKRYDFDTARDLVRSFYGPMLRDEIQPVALGGGMGMADVMRRKRELLRLTLPGEFLFLFRIRFGLMSVLARLGARANWYRLERACAEAAPR